MLFSSAVLLSAVIAIPITVSRCQYSNRYYTNVHIGAIQAALEKYREQYGQYPTGDNRGITAALCGENEKHITFISIATNTLGQSIDMWKHPLCFEISDNTAVVFSVGIDLDSRKDDIYANE